MLEGIVAAGFHCCFFGTGRGWLRAGTGTAALALGGFFLPGIRPAVPLLTALWIMLTGFWLHEGRREEVFLAGGLWLMALALAEGLGAVQGLAGLLAGRETDLAAGLAAQVPTGEMGAGNPAAAGLWAWAMRGETLGSVWENAHFPGEAQTALAAALILMAALHLLGRGGLHPLWMAALTLMWLLAGFLGSIEYARPWQDRVMGLALYLTAGGLLACQQVFCARQELERAFWENGRGEWPGYPGSAGKPGGAEEPENPEAPAAGPPEKDVRSLAGKQRKKGGDAPAAAAGASFTGGARDWRQAADREFRRMQIFEHDFRHHLDMVAALYEEGDPAEARAYLEDLKQSRVSRQGRRIGGERELSYIMMAKREACREAGISFSYQIVGSPRGIAQMDMTALLLNLLDNAIRACQEAPMPRSISVMLLARGELWEIEMINSGSYRPGQEPGSSPGKEGDGAAHGLGLVSVGQIVEKYQGSSRLWQEDGQVRQKVILVQRNAE